jgi:nicotinamidase-related amidase
MTITALDPKTALIVIDLQKGILSYLPAQPLDIVVKHATALTEAFRRHNLPIVLVNATGGAPGRTEQARNLGERPADWVDLIPELNQQPPDHVVTKQTWGAFTNTDLDEHLKRLGVTQVVIIGVATSIGVESTARHAYEFGFHVTLAVDAMADMSEANHVHSVTRIFPRLGETGTAQEIIDLLDRSRA